MTIELTALALAGLLQVIHMILHIITLDMQTGIKAALGQQD